MDFSDQTFSGETDLSGLVLVSATFDRAKFVGDVKLSDKTRFYAQVWFHDVVFEGRFFCDRAQFDASVSFAGARFKKHADFWGTKFMGGAAFDHVTFEGQVMFNDSRFEERYFSSGITIPQIADFRNTKFKGRALFIPSFYYQMTPKISLNIRCSISISKNLSINGRTRSSGQLGIWSYNINP